MKKIRIDLRHLSVVIALFLTMIFLTSAGTEGAGPIGRFQAVTSERGFIILDTKSGDYIIESRHYNVPKLKWSKGDFKTSFERGQDEGLSR
jgi:hypothetical protein